MRGSVHTIRLHGHLRRFGASLQLACTSPADAAKALIMQMPGFREALEQGAYHVIRRQSGKPRTVYEDGSELTMALGESCTLHFVPSVTGSKSGGVGKAILGVVIMVAAVVAAPYTGGTSLAAGLSGFTFGFAGATAFGIGAMMLMSGVSQMLTPTAKVGGKGGGRAEERRSFILNGQLDATVQGMPVPVVYGRYRVPLTIISAGLAPEAI